MRLDHLLIVLKNVGLLFRYIAWVPLLLLLVVLWYGEWHAAPSVLLTSLLFYGVGFALSLVPAPREPRLRDGLVIAATGWLLIPLGSVLVFVLVEGWRPLDAYLESMSAWTGTGFTIADVTGLSHTTLAWRSLMQWVGGLGVIVLALAILARPGTGAFQLYAGEAREDKLRPSVLSTVRTLWWIYLAITVLAVALLLLVGLPPWEALNHGMTGIATAGMTVTPNSIGDYESPAVQWAFVAIMLAGAVPFLVHYAVFRGRYRTFLRDEQVRALFALFLLALPFFWWGLRWMDSDTLREAAFQLGSAVSTTGFQTTDLREWSPAMKLALGGLMVVGGAAGSTAGGIKLVRGVLLVKGALWKLERSGLPHFALTSFRFGGQKLDRNEANEAFAEAAFTGVLFVGILFGATVTLVALLPGAALVDVLFETASVVGNNGMSAGVVSRDLPDQAKATFLAIMWAARLEVLPVLLLIRGLLPLRNR